MIQVLKDSSAHGRLSQETFMARVDAALQAKDSDELAVLICDLPAPPRRGPGRWWPADRRPRWQARRTSRSAFSLLAARATGHGAALAGQMQAVWRGHGIPSLVLPRGREVFTIGRAHDCDLPLTDMTVSRYHAELRREGDEWLLVDIGSTNGTRANGWRVGSGFAVRPGDRVTFGAVTFRLADHA